MYHLQLNKLHGYKEKQIKHGNILECLPLAKKCKAKHSKLVKTMESSLLAEYTGFFLKV